MSALGDEFRRPDRDAMILDCAARMSALFGRLPMLIGFTVQDSALLTDEHELAPIDEELYLADVTVHAWPGFQPTADVRAEIATTILEVLAEHPDARELMRGYTFARAFH